MKSWRGSPEGITCLRRWVLGGYVRNKCSDERRGIISPYARFVKHRSVCTEGLFKGKRCA